MDQRKVVWILEVIHNIFWLPVGRKCCQTAIAGLRLERSRCTRPRLYWYKGQYNINQHYSWPTQRQIVMKFGVIRIVTLTADKNFEFLKSKMADGRHFEKPFKSPYLSNVSPSRYEIWYNNAF